MLMPEASMHEDHLAPPAKHEVGLSRQVTGMQSIPIPVGVQ